MCANNHNSIIITVHMLQGTIQCPMSVESDSVTKDGVPDVMC